MKTLKTTPTPWMAGLSPQTGQIRIMHHVDDKPIPIEAAEDCMLVKKMLLCVNSPDDLLAVCESLKNWNDWSEVAAELDSIIQNAEKAIAKAQGEKP